MTSPPDYDIRLIVRALRRYWWLVIAIPTLALAFQVFQVRTAPYRVEFRAVVVLPGDTEIPGSSERPELMIMDDVPTLVDSALFAERVRAELQAGSVVLGVDEVEAALSATRFARTVTVVARDDERSRAVAIASAAQGVLGDVVNEVLVVGDGPAAEVTIVDPVDGAHRGEPGQWTAALIVTAGMALLAVIAALVLDGLRRPNPAGAQPGEVREASERPA